MMDLEKGNLDKNRNTATPISFKTTNGNTTTSTVNIYSSNISCLNGITNEEMQQSATSEKPNDHSKNVLNYYQMY